MQTSWSRPSGLLTSGFRVGLLLLVAGCSSRGTVSGKVSYKDKPLPGGTVLFIHEKKGSFTSKIGDDGSYLIANVPEGQVKIVVTGPWTSADTNDARRDLVRMPGQKGFTDAELEKMKKTMPDVDEAGLKQMMGLRPTQDKKSVLIPPKYSNPEKSGLTYTVGGGTQTHDIKLE
jgi:hypothetical protein